MKKWNYLRKKWFVEWKTWNEWNSRDFLGMLQFSSFFSFEFEFFVGLFSMFFNSCLWWMKQKTLDTFIWMMLWCDERKQILRQRYQLFLISCTFQCFLSTPPFLLLALFFDSFRASLGSFSLRSALAFLARSLKSSGSSHSVEWGNHFGAASTP